jgi:GNAT superfamily N-acetyltransferase
MTTKLYQQYDGTQVTDSMLREASQLFNENYGIWGKESGSKMGTRIKMSKDRLRAQLLPSNVPCSYVRVTVDGDLAGNVFACRWKYNGVPVCWVTQLVVHRDYRERGLAAGLLNELRQEDEDIYGVVSSHPAACLATAKAFGRKHNLRAQFKSSLIVSRYHSRSPAQFYQRSRRSDHGMLTNKLHQRCQTQRQSL